MSGHILIQYMVHGKKRNEPVNRAITDLHTARSPKSGSRL